MRDAFRAQPVPTCSGASELRGLKLSDAIGHVHPDSELVVFNAYKTWLAKCLEVEDRLSQPLSEPVLCPPPPPPLPEYGVLEEPWQAEWDDAAQAYGFFLRELGFAQWEVPLASVSGWFYGRGDTAWCWRELATGATADRPPPPVQHPWRAP